jgi:hypothetical protein
VHSRQTAIVTHPDGSDAITGLLSLLLSSLSRLDHDLVEFFFGYGCHTELAEISM